MVLDADHIRGQRNLRRRCSTWNIPELKVLTLKDIALTQSTRDLTSVAKVLEIAFALTGDRGVDGVMEVVTPHCVQSITAAALRAYQLGIVLVGLSDHANRASQFVR